MVTLREQLNGLSNDDLVTIWNIYQKSVGGERQIYLNDTYFFDDMYEHSLDAIRAIYFGRYKYNDRYLYIDNYNNIVSFNNINDDDSPYSENEVLDFMRDNNIKMFTNWLNIDE